MRTRIAIVGSRKYRPIERVRDFLLTLDVNTHHIITGDADGVDSEARFWAARFKFPFTIYPANWYPDGGIMDKGAGFKRNVEIVNASDDMEVFWDGRSHGSAHDIHLWYMKTGHQPHVFGPAGLPIEVSHREVMDILKIGARR